MRDKKDSGPRLNERIRLSPVRLIDANGENLGIIPTRNALAMAQEQGLDLVEIVAHARPPVCRIIDYGKFKYEQSKKDKEQRQKQRSSQMKEVRFRPSIGDHDVDTKVVAIQKFLADGQKVQLRVQFFKREHAHKDLGFKLVNDIIARVKDKGHAQSPPKMDGRDIICILEPGENNG